ncbi:hypothetical protein M0R45_018083 [Rubus argutus]|uniref:Endonuclease/exonuclease/phosphatase domain-containing protein n=1 Tax=Rubus argutus TaxID=59490 RepID=A0AAW1Y024_RUBAR
MKIISWNIRGLGSKNKRRVIKEILVNKGADIVILQETKKVEVDRKLVSSIWGARYKNWTSIPSTGRTARAGGILIMWNTKFVFVIESVVGDFTISIKIRAVMGRIGGFREFMDLTMSENGQIFGKKELVSLGYLALGGV